METRKDLPATANLALVLWLLVVVGGAYAYFFRFEDALGFASGAGQLPSDDASDAYYSVYRQLIPYKLPFLFLEIALCVASCVTCRVLMGSYGKRWYARAVFLISASLLVVYLLVGLLAGMAPYGMVS
jgi:hypothetical protein